MKKESKLNFRKSILVSMLCMLVAGVLFTGCSKGDNVDPDNPNRTHQVSDLEVIINEREFNEGGGSTNSYSISYEVKNKKNIPFVDLDHDYSTRFKIKTTDGSEYQTENHIDDMSANGSYVNTTSITLPKGKTPNESTFTYEIFANN